MQKSYFDDFIHFDTVAKIRKCVANLGQAVENGDEQPCFITDCFIFATLPKGPILKKGKCFNLTLGMIFALK